MKPADIAVRVALLALVTIAFDLISVAQKHPPLDHQAVSGTHSPHIDTQASINPGNFRGMPKATVTPTTTFPEADESIAIDPTSFNNSVAVVSDFSMRGGFNVTKYVVSFNNGAAETWFENFVPLAGGLPATSDLQTWEANSNPVVAIDKLGNVYASNLYLNASNNANGLYVSVGQLTSPSLGFSVAETIPVATNTAADTTTIEDKDWIAVDNTNNFGTTGNVYVCWTRFIDGLSRIMISRSTDHGQTWSSPLEVSDTWQVGAVQGPQVAVGPAGEVYVVYEVFFTGNLRQHFLIKSTDGGQTFGPSVAITPFFNELNLNSTYRTNSFASLAVNPTNGHVYVVYSDQPSSTTGAEVEFISSTDGGGTFTTPVAINNPAKGQQFFPALAVDSSGVICVSWFDTRNTFKGTSSYDVYFTNSGNDGNKFAANVRVTPASIDAGNATFIGNYTGLAVSGGYAHPAWTSGGFNNGLLQTTTLH